jgi:diacylglycerol kinase (ATP)
VKVLLLHNPTAGSDQTSQDELTSLLSRAGCDVEYLPTDHPELPQRVTDKVDALAIAGGDGTVAKVLTHLNGDTAPVTILPMGTANNLARALGIRASLPELVAGLRHGRVVPMDVGMSEGPWGRQRFFESAGFGAIAQALGPVNKSKVPSHQKIPQGRHAMREVFQDMRPARFRIRLDDQTFEEELLILELAKIASLGPRLCLAPEADPGDGFIHVASLPVDRRQAMLDWLDDPEDGGAAPMVVRRAREAEVTWHDTPSHLDDFFHEEPQQSATMSAWLEPSAVKVLVPGRQTG